MTANWIDEAEQRAEEATDGPWESNGDGIFGPKGLVCDDWAGIGTGIFISAARTDVPRLCKALRIALAALVDENLMEGGYLDEDGRREIGRRIRKGDF